jgi:isocitrate lyase
VVQQQGTIPQDYTVARRGRRTVLRPARELFANGKSITTFGPYTPGQAVAMKRIGIEGIYLGGWATSAKGSVPRTRAPTWRAIRSAGARRGRAHRARAPLTADRNQEFLRSRMTESSARDAQGGLSAVHHRRRRHRPRR